MTVVEKVLKALSNEPVAVRFANAPRIPGVVSNDGTYIIIGEHTYIRPGTTIIVATEIERILILSDQSVIILVKE